MKEYEKKVIRRARLYIVVPCFNESEIISETIPLMTEKINNLISGERICDSSKILVVDDGSTDNSWGIIKELCDKDDKVCAVSLSKNKGHQKALLAGLMTAKNIADVTITIDADLQQDIEAIDDFLDEYYKGSDIVYGIRKGRDTDGLFKKVTAGMYYSLMNLFGVGIKKDSADYRLLSSRTLKALSEYDEVNLFLRGIVTDIGFKSSEVYFNVNPRNGGKSKYTIKKMFRLAIDGITSFSIAPIHIISGMGALSILISVIMIIIVIVDWIQGKNIPGYSTILISIWFIGGLLLFGLGVVGEYIGQTYMEAKHRPRYFIKDTYKINQDEETDEDFLSCR